MLFNRFPIFISGGSASSPGPQPSLCQSHSHLRRTGNCTRSQRAPALSWGASPPHPPLTPKPQVLGCWGCLEPKGHLRVLAAIPIFPAVEWDCLSRQWEQQWGQHRTSPGSQTLLGTLTLTSCSLPPAKPKPRPECQHWAPGQTKHPRSFGRPFSPLQFNSIIPLSSLCCM